MRTLFPIPHPYFSRSVRPPVRTFPQDPPDATATRMEDVIDVLLNKAQTYLRSAAVLLELEDYDSCASRAYFAMFYAAQAALLTINGALPDDQGIRSAFADAFVASGRLPRHAAAAFDRAYELHEVGDYSHAYAISIAVAERALQEAEAFVNTLARLAHPVR